MYRRRESESRFSRTFALTGLDLSGIFARREFFRSPPRMAESSELSATTLILPQIPDVTPLRFPPSPGNGVPHSCASTRVLGLTTCIPVSVRASDVYLYLHSRGLAPSIAASRSWPRGPHPRIETKAHSLSLSLSLCIE